MLGLSPPPPSPPFDVLNLLLLLISVLSSTLLILLLRKHRRHATVKTATATAATAATSTKTKPLPANDYPRGPLLILWGSQTGTAEGFGNELMREARQRGWNAKSVDLEEVSGEDLESEAAPVVLLMATHGEGEPTDNAVEFYKWANDKERDEERPFGGLRYAVFALGNTQYEHFCYMGRWAHRRLAELGATPVCDLGEGDDDDDILNDFELWMEGLWPALSGEAGKEDGAGAAVNGEGEVPHQASYEVRFLKKATTSLPLHSWLGRAFPKQQLYECKVSTCRELTNDPTKDSGSVKHIEFACAAVDGTSTVTYEAADDLGVCCDGGLPLAKQAADALGLDLTSTFELHTLPTAPSGIPPPLPTPCTVEYALRYHADLRAPASKQMLKLLAAYASNPTEASRLQYLASPQGKEEYSTYIQRDGRGFAELISTTFKSCSGKVPFAAALELLPKLTPRYYTISSAPERDSSTVHLTVKVLREPMRNSAAGRMKEGVCSTQLGDLRAGSKAHVFVRPSAFRLPRNKSTPIIMIGPGTGVAPFRAFLQKMGADGRRGRSGEVRLYFGCRRESIDFLYREELEGSKALTSLRTAFSREVNQPKVYVQERIKEDGMLLHKLMAEEKGHVYICGGTAMGREVVSLLTGLFVSHGKQSEVEAASSIKKMASEGRLVQELWS